MVAERNESSLRSGATMGPRLCEDDADEKRNYRLIR